MKRLPLLILFLVASCTGKQIVVKSDLEQNQLEKQLVQSLTKESDEYSSLVRSVVYGKINLPLKGDAETGIIFNTIVNPKLFESIRKSPIEGVKKIFLLNSLKADANWVKRHYESASSRTNGLSDEIASLYIFQFQEMIKNMVHVKNEYLKLQEKAKKDPTEENVTESYRFGLFNSTDVFLPGFMMEYDVRLSNHKLYTSQDYKVLLEGMHSVLPDIVKHLEPEERQSLKILFQKRLTQFEGKNAEILTSMIDLL